MKLNTKIHFCFYHLMYEIDHYLFGVINEPKDNIYFKFVRRLIFFSSTLPCLGTVQNLLDILQSP